MYQAVTQDALWRLGNNFPVRHLETTSEKRVRRSCQRLQQLLETAASCWWGPQSDGKCTFDFYCYFSIQLQQTRPQTESCVFSDVGNSDASAWFLNQDLGFTDASTWFMSLRRVGTITHHCCHLSTDLRVNWSEA